VDPLVVVELPEVEVELPEVEVELPEVEVELPEVPELPLFPVAAFFPPAAIASGPPLDVDPESVADNVDGTLKLWLSAIAISCGSMPTGKVSESSKDEVPNLFVRM